MSLFVDTSVWSLAMRRDAPPTAPEVHELGRAIEARNSVFATGLVLQELLQGFSKPKAQEQIIERFRALPMLIPERKDHIQAAELRNTFRRNGVQVGTIDALLAQMCIRYGLVILTTDKDFRNAATLVPLSVWTP